MLQRNHLGVYLQGVTDLRPPTQRLLLRISAIFSIRRTKTRKLKKLFDSRSNQAKLRSGEIEQNVLERYESTLGADPANTITSFRELAVTYELQGRFEEAEFNYRRVLEVREDSCERSHRYL